MNGPVADPIRLEHWDEYVDGPYWQTPLIYAAKQGDMEMLEKLHGIGTKMAGSWCVVCRAPVKRRRSNS